jgi:RimJ/RimL family protein N-acetyltransferase
VSEYHNELGQPIGFPVENWRPCEYPRGAQIQGRLCRLEPIDIDDHASDLFDAFSRDRDQRNWTYLPYGPFATEEELRAWMLSACLGDDPCFFSVIDNSSGKAAGVASYLRIEPGVGVIEVGHIHFSPLMQGKPVSTEAMYLMMRQVFDVWGYRRYEWKCDSLNQVTPRGGSVLCSRVSSARRPCTSIVIAIPPGSRCWTASGRRRRLFSKVGSTPRISTPMAAREPVCPRRCARHLPLCVKA